VAAVQAVGRQRRIMPVWPRYARAAVVPPRQKHPVQCPHRGTMREPGVGGRCGAVRFHPLGSMETARMPEMETVPRVQVNFNAARARCSREPRRQATRA